MAGRKLRCGECGMVINVPDDREPELELLGGDDDLMAEPAPMEIPDHMLSMEEGMAPPDLMTSEEPPEPEPEMPPEDLELEQAPTEEPVVQQTHCPECGAEVQPTDAVCLACGSELTPVGEGLVNKVLNKVPKHVLIGAGAGIGVLFLLIIVIMIWRSGQDAKYVAQARSQLELDDMIGAQNAFKQALEWNPKNVDALTGMINCALKTKKAPPTKYMNTLRSALSAAKANGDEYDKEAVFKAYYGAAQYFKNKRDWKKAERYHKKAKSFANAERKKTLTELLGHIKFSKGERDLAKKEYESAVDDGSDDPLVYLNLSRILRRRGKKVEAEKLIKRALKMSPAEANTELARIKLQDSKFKESETYWKAAVRANGNYHPARVGYADILVKLGKPKEALTQVTKAKELKPNDAATMAVLCQVLYRSKQYEKASKEVDTLLKRDDKNTTGLFYRGALLILKGLKTNNKNQQKEGEKLLTRTVRSIGTGKAYFEAAEILSQVPGKENTAVKLVQDAIKTDLSLIPAHILYIELLRKSNQGTRVKQALEEALRVAPQNIELNVELSNAYWEDQQEIEAMNVLRKLLKADADNEDILYRLAVRLMQRSSLEREEVLDDTDRKKLLVEALEILDEKLRKKLKSSKPDLTNRISSVKNQLLEIS